MTEQPNTAPRPDDDEDGSAASVTEDAGRHGVVRTAGETAVDDALGQGPPPER